MIIDGMFVTNNAYTVYDMVNGSDYSKIFEATDWLNLICVGKLYNAQGQLVK